MMSPTCVVCGKDLPDWQANLMVDNHAYTYEQRLDRLRVICKACSRAMIGTPDYSKYHNIWELVWVKERFVHLLGVLLFDQSSQSSLKWSDEALDDFYGLAVLRFPDLNEGILSALSD